MNVLVVKRHSLQTSTPVHGLILVCKLGEVMTIHQDYLATVDKKKKQHREELEKLKSALEKQQLECPHPKWERHEAMFYALGETAPGERCLECGLQRHVSRTSENDLV
jgi:hypothetical protein